MQVNNNITLSTSSKLPITRSTNRRLNSLFISVFNKVLVKIGGLCPWVFN